MVLALVYVRKSSNHVIYILAGFVLLAAITEVLLQKITKKEIKSRIVE